MKTKQQRKKKHRNNNDPSGYVTLDLCHAYQKALDTKIKYLFGTSILTVILILVQLFRGM